ncbi:MAG: dipeptidase PepE, partial [Acaryochloridaceae cyanobacterium RU_4_10]|nr:dipeptidase PepE [Acaryochloridaceae cyanobacterium RU_4_10]
MTETTRLLLLSNSTMPGTPFFTWSKSYVTSFLAGKVSDVLFIPWAGVTISFDNYLGFVKEAFATLGLHVRSLHHEKDAVAAVADASCFVVGGGNTFALLARLYESGVLEHLRERVLAGAPYIGWSAGANIACPTIMTTNDMPVVQPPSLRALNLIPFQLNPHYHELKFANQGGETRADRLNEFLILNPTRLVLGCRKVCCWSVTVPNSICAAKGLRGCLWRASLLKTWCR